MARDWYQKSGAKTSSKTSSFLPSGCFNSVFHLFDFRHFHFPLNHQTTPTASTITTSISGCSCFRPEPDSILPPPTIVVKGAEAPRNSLESEDELLSTSTTSASASVSLTSTSKEDDLNIPVRVRVKTRNETSSEISSSPGTKTPTLVARLMGLDLLPESPSYSSTPNLKPLQTRITSHRKSLDGDIRGRTGTRSLPETPRISSARRSESDVDIHRHRLSLQINKENMSPSEELGISRLKGLKRRDLKHEDIQENKSPSHYARMIVKQVKESVGRKLGTDITNTVRNRESSNQHSRALTKLDDHSKPRFLDSNQIKPVVAIDPSSVKEHDTRIQARRAIRVLAKPFFQRVQEEQDEHQKQHSIPRGASKCKKIMSGEKFGSSRLKRPPRTSDVIRNKQEEPFVRPSTDKKTKKTPLSNDLLNISVPTLLPVKKDHSLLPKKITQIQVLAAQKPKRSSLSSSCSSQVYNNSVESTTVHLDRDDKNDYRSTTGDVEAEYEYIDRILRRIGLNKSTPLSYISWFSPSHPLDPSIFYYIEHFTTCSTHLRHRCNRKLLFHLVDEILIEILKPYFNSKPRGVVLVGIGHDISRINGSGLMEILCSRIRRFPRADCRVLEDIDGLIEQDFEMKDQIVKAYEEEGEGIVAEIEKEIIEGLMHETASDFVVRV